MTKKKGTLLKDTGERMVPEFHKGGNVWGLVYAEHFTRYLCAQKLVQDKIILDIACGSGYGSQLLAKKAEKVYGVDISEEAINYAQKNFKAKNLTYLAGDGMAIPLEDNSVDIVITFETIEHIENYEKFLSEVKRVLKNDGLAIISTPNDLEFAEGNHFHVHEFKYNELQKVVKKYFRNIKPYFQATWKYVAVGSEQDFSKEGSAHQELLNLSPLKRDEFLYFYFLCSNRKITEAIEPIGALGGHYSDRALLAERSIAESQIVRGAALEQKVAELSRTINDLTKQLTSLTNSKAYKVAKKLRTVRRILPK